jgi:hypothetical protein
MVVLAEACVFSLCLAGVHIARDAALVTVLER